MRDGQVMDTHRRSRADVMSGTRAVAAPSGSAARAARAKADLPFPGGPTRRTGDARVRRVLLTKQSRVVSIVGTKTSPGPALIEQLTNSCGIIPEAKR